METIVDISPHLREILKSIMKKSNGCLMTIVQLNSIGPDLYEFEKKIASFFESLEINRAIVVHGPEYKPDTIVKIVKTLMKNIEIIEEELASNHYEPMLFELMNGGRNSARICTDYLMKKIMPHLEISSAIGRPVTSLQGLPRFVRQAGRLIDDALLVLARLSPSRRISITGTFHVQYLQKESIISIPKLCYTDQFRKVFGHYDMHILNIHDVDFDGNCLLKMILTQSLLNDTVCENLYNKKASEMTIFDLLQSEAELYCDDINFGPRALWAKIGGSGISSLDFSLNLLCLIGMRIFEENNSRADFRRLFRDIGMKDIMYLCNYDLLSDCSRKMEIDTMQKVYEDVTHFLQSVQLGMYNFGYFQREIQSLHWEFSDDKRVV